MTLPMPEILFEDNHVIAVAKPAGCLSTHFQGREETVDRSIKHYLKEKYRKPGNVVALEATWHCMKPVTKEMVLLVPSEKVRGIPADP